MAKYLSVEFTGTSQNLIKFLEYKAVNYDEIKHIAGNRVFLKLSQESADDVKYLQEMPFSDLSDDKITNVNLISESEYTNTAENGFEIIHAQNVQPKLTHTEPTPSFLLQEEVVKNTVVNEQGFPSPLVETTLNRVAQNEPRTVVHTEPKTVEEFRNHIAQTLNDTVLPSKSPLPREDPFVFLTSAQYLRNFIFASTFILFLLAIFD